MELSQIFTSADCNPTRVTKADKNSVKKLDFKDMKLPVKVRNKQTIEQKNSIDTSIFGYEKKEKHRTYLSKKCCEEEHVELLLIGEEGTKHCVLIKVSFMCDHTLIVEEKIFAVVYKLSVHKKYYNFILKIDLKLTVNKGLY